MVLAIRGGGGARNDSYSSPKEEIMAPTDGATQPQAIGTSVRAFGNAAHSAMPAGAGGKVDF